MSPSRSAHRFHAEPFGDFAFLAIHGESSDLSLLEPRTFASQVVCLRYGARHWSLAEAVLLTAAASILARNTHPLSHRRGQPPGLDA